jgi:hypothetical protein
VAEPPHVTNVEPIVSVVVGIESESALPGLIAMVDSTDPLPLGTIKDPSALS